MHYKNLKIDKWFKLSFIEQMANIGSEVIRAISWKNKGEPEYSQRAIERALELLWFTIEDGKNKVHLKELCRLKEILIDYFYFDNIYKTTSEFLEKYFLAFNYAARKNCGTNCKS